MSRYFQQTGILAAGQNLQQHWPQSIVFFAAADALDREFGAL